MKGKVTETSAAVESPALTRQRDAVLRAVRESPGHLTAAEIFEAARAILPGLSYATVYNSLRHLKGIGLIAEVTFGSGASRYDKVTSRHDHALCTQCGALVDFDLPPSADFVRAAARRCAFTPHSVHVTLLGTCRDCADTARPRAKASQ